jgi:hypothetical protein
MILRRRASLILSTFAAAAMLAVACSSSNSVAPCSPSVGQTTTAFAAAGGSAAVAVTAGSGCTWSATSGASFVAITAGQSGSGNGTVQFSVAANPGAARSTTLTIASTTLTITQTGTTTPQGGTLSAPSANSPSEGALVDSGTPTLVVNNAVATGNAGTVTYRFEISDLPTFPADPARNFSQDGIAQGNGTTSWVVTQNLGPSVRWFWHARAVGTGAPASEYSSVAAFSTRSTTTTIQCSYALTNPNNGSAQQSAPPNGGAFNANLTASPAGCAWSLAVDQSSPPGMLSISSATTGPGNTTMGFGVTALPAGTTSRRGTIRVQTTVTGRTGSAIYTVIQQ